MPRNSRPLPRRHLRVIALILPLVCVPAFSAGVGTAAEPPPAAGESAPAAAAAVAARACQPDPDAPPAERIAACSPLLAAPARLGGLLARELGITSEAAAYLARGLVLDLTWRPRREGTAVVREIESNYVNALKLAPESPDLAAQLHHFYLAWLWAVRSPGKSLVDLIAKAHDPEALALRLLMSDRDKPWDSPVYAEILLAALASRPHSAALWVRAASFTGEPAWKLAFLAEATRNAAPSSGEPAAGAAGSATAAPIAARQLAELFDRGLAREMLRVFAGLPEPVRALFAQGAQPASLPLLEWPDTDSPTGRRDLRLELAAAQLLAGDAGSARQWAARAGLDESPARTKQRLAAEARAAAATAGAARAYAEVQEAAARGDMGAPSAARQSSAEEDAARGERQADRWRLVVESWIEPRTVDSFPLLSAWISESGHLSRYRGWTLVAARFARRDGYPGFAAHLLAGVSRLQRRDADNAGGWQPSVAVPPRVRQDAQRLAAALAELSSEVGSELGAVHAARRAALPPDPAAATIARLLASPRSAAFAERPMPAGLRPSHDAPPRPSTKGGAATKPLALPAGFSAVRAERQGNRAAAIGVAQDYDRAGAYWVVLSEDGGNSWERPLYTGLRVSQPYVVVERSALPLLAGDLLQVEVELHEVDPASSTLQSASLEPKRTAKAKTFYLEIPLALLRQDSDGDGLTDLAEERLLTDPFDPDTDHDGRADGIDLLPQVAQLEDESPRTRALAECLEEISGTAFAGKAPVPASQRTLFVVGDRALFAGIRPSLRLVVLTPEERAAAEKKLGPFYAVKIELFEIDRAGHSALAIWSSPLEFGMVRLEEQGGTFKVVDAMFEIS